MKIEITTPILAIGVVESLTGLTRRQIRYYDQKKLVVPYRTDGNSRLYSLEEVNLLLTIKTQRKLGKDIEQIKNFLKKNKQLSIEKINLNKGGRFNAGESGKIYLSNNIDGYNVR